MAILQTQEKNIKNPKARVIQPNWGSETGGSWPCLPLQPVVRALPEGRDDGSRRQYSLRETPDLRAGLIANREDLHRQIPV